MNHTKLLQRLVAVLVLVFLTACTIYAVTPQPPPMQPGQPPQQPGQSQPGAPGPTGGNGAGPAPSGSALVDQAVTVPGGGGNAEVSFNGTNGQRIQIDLTASNADMQPYGSLQYPDGTSVYNPPINTAANGANKAEITLNQSGGYTLTVFDGSNQGGTVSVKIAASQ